MLNNQLFGQFEDEKTKNYFGFGQDLPVIGTASQEKQSPIGRIYLLSQAVWVCRSGRGILVRLRPPLSALNRKLTVSKASGSGG